jgi:SAM-dependent methyltransferase
MHKLFNEFGHRYDLHTPPSHYQHDHQLVLQLAKEYGPNCRLLDVGTGTGVLLEKARLAGIDAHGIDIAPAMIDAAKRRVPAESLRLLAMQDLNDVALYDIVVSLSWSIHYCKDLSELGDVLQRLMRALKPGGLLLLQVAHSSNFTGEWLEDREPGPTGEADDVVLRFRCRPDGAQHGFADYAYTCLSRGEEFLETHRLVGADANWLTGQVAALGAVDVGIWNSWRRDPLSDSGIVFVWAVIGSSRNS